MRKLSLLLIFCFLLSNAYAAFPPVNLLEQDGSPSVFPTKVRFPNTSLSDTATGLVVTFVGVGGGSETTTVSDTATVDLTLTGADITGDVLEAGIEAILELQDLQGAVTDAQVPDNITITEVDGSTTNELPAAGTYIDVSGQTVSVDPTEMEGVAFGGGAGASIVWTIDLAAGDPIITFGNAVVNISSGALQEGGNAVYNSGETPGGELGGTWASPTIDDSVAVTSWNLTTPTITTSLTTSTPTTLTAAELDRLDGLAGIIVTDVTACTDLEGNGLTIAAGTLNFDGGDAPAGELGNTWASPTIDADAVLWNEIGDAGADATIAMGANETDFTSTIDAAGEAVLTITNTDADAANANTILTLSHNDGADVSVNYLSTIADADGSPLTTYYLAQNATVGAISMGLGATGVILSDDADGALTITGNGAGQDESLIINLDDTANQIVLSSGSSATDINFSGLDLTLGGGNLNTGNIALTIGDGTTDGVTLSTDGTGNGELTLPADSLGIADIDWGTGAGQVPLSKSFVVNGTIDTNSDYGNLWKTPVAITITAVNMTAMGGAASWSIVGHLDECDANGANCAGVDGATDITCTQGTNAADDGTLSNPSIDANDWCGFHTTSTTWTTGGKVGVTIYYTQ